MTHAAPVQLRAQAMLELRRRREAGEGVAPSGWRDWLKALFPKLFSHPFARHHAEFWQWIEAIEPGTKPPAFFAIWARGGAKTTNAEAAVVRLGAKETRKLVLYVRATQDKANESVQNIAAMLESKAVSAHYPKLSKRKLSKYGFARGWRVDVLRCSNGFSVIGLGLNAAIRGVKIEDARPDLIILDDIDDKGDDIAAVSKKIDTLTKSILPAGSSDVAILGVQNLIHDESIFTSISDGTADFLYDRIVSGPHPAVIGLEYEERDEGGYTITAGKATWVGQDLATCESQINTWGPTAFLNESQHEVTRSGGIWDHIEFRHIEYAQVPDIVRGAVWIDPAVTSTDKSDSQGIQADGLGADGKLYRFFSWEAITSPEDAVRRAILKALELGFTTVGIETDQGGDTWISVYDKVWNSLSAGGKSKPKFKQAKAGAGHGSKVERNQRMLADYELGKIIHVRGTHKALERALLRFPNKPLDLADVAYWGWFDLMNKRFLFG